MGLSLGGIDLSNVSIGATNLSAISIGSVDVWSAGGGPPPGGGDYLDSATRTDRVGPGPDWTNVLQPATGYRINVVSNTWGITYGFAWIVERNDVAAPTTGNYEVSLEVAVAGGTAYRVYINPKVYAEFDGANGYVYTAATYGGASTVRSPVGSVVLATNTKMALRKVGNVYTIYKDGVATAATWNDSGAVYAAEPKVTAMGMDSSSTGYRCKNFRVKDV